MSARSARGDDAAVPQAPPTAEKKRTSAELQELMGPVALYPDEVLSSLLPATAYPLQVVVAARWLRAQPPGGKVEAPASAGWDEHVKALLQLPEVLTWMDENIEWVGQAGEALATQHADVLAAVQSVRALAEKSDKLKPEAPASEGAQVPPEGATAPLGVEPADPGAILIPFYEPAPMIVEQPWPVLGFGFGLGYGYGFGSAWLYSEPCWSGSYGLGWGCGGYGYGYGGWGGYGYGGCGGYGYGGYGGYGGCGGYGYGAVHNAGVRSAGVAALQGGGGNQGTRVAGGAAAVTAGPGGAGRGAAGVRQQMAQQGSGGRPGSAATLPQGSARSGLTGSGVAGTRSSTRSGLAQSSRTAPGSTTLPGGAVRSGLVAGPWGRTQSQVQRGSSTGQARPYSIQGTRAGLATGNRSTLPGTYGASPQRGTYPGRYSGSYSGSYSGVAQGRFSPQRTTGAYNSQGRAMGSYISPGGRLGTSSYGGAQGYSSRGQASMGTRSMGGGFSGGSRGGGFSGGRSGGGGGRGGGGARRR